MMKQETNQLKIGVVLSYLNLGIGNLIPIFYTPVMLALLGQAEYGLFKLSSSVTSYLSLISLGIGAAVSRYLIKARTEQGQEAEENFLGLFQILFQLIAVVTFLAGFVLISQLWRWYGTSLTERELERMQLLVFLMVCNTALTFSATPYVSVVSTHERFVFLQLMNILSTCVMPLLNLLMLWLGYASVGMAASSLAIGVLIRVGYVLYVRRVLGIRARYRRLPLGQLKEILTFSFWIFVSNVVAQLYNSTDTVMIGAVPALAVSGVAIYNVGLTFNSMMFSVTTSISSLLSPKVNKMVFSGASKEALTDLATRVGRLQCYIMVLIIAGFIAFGRPFVYFYAGEAYSAAYWVAILMMVPNIIPLTQSVFLSVVIAENRHRFRSLTYLAIAVLNVVGTWVLLEPFGIIGAAFMTGFALLLGQGLVMNWFYYRRCRLDVFRFFRSLGPTLAVPAALCCVTLVLSRWIDFYRPATLLAGIAAFTLADLALNWRFVMNDYEKGLFLGLLKKLQRKQQLRDRNRSSKIQNNFCTDTELE